MASLLKFYNLQASPFTFALLPFTFLVVLILAMGGPAAAAPTPADDRPATSAGGLRINRIVINGCRLIPRRTVRSILQQQKTPWYRLNPGRGAYDPFWAEDDRNRMELFYRSRGFYLARVSAPEVKLDRRRRGVTITYQVSEGKPTLVTRIEVIFEDGVYREQDRARVKALIALKAGRRFELAAYQQSAEAIAGYFQDWGFFRVRVTRGAEVDPAAGTALVSFRIVRGNRYKIREIKVAGVKRTDESVVYRAIDLETSKWYNRSEVIKNQRRVQKLPIYRVVRVVETADDENRKVDLTFKVEEGKPREVRVGVGYGSEEGVRVQGTWRHVNLFGGAREFSVSARWSELMEREEIRFAEPNVKQPGDFIQVVAVRQVDHELAYTHEAVGLSPTYHFILTDYLWAEVSYRIEQNLTSRIENALAIKAEDLAREGILSALTARLEWADVDNPINTRRGARASLVIEYGGGFLGGDFPYLKASGEARAYYPILPQLVIAARGKIGWAEPLGDLQTLPIFIRYFAGGSTSVRGFARNELGPLDPNGQPIGGSRLYEGNLELRFPLYRELGGVVFLDTGWVWPESQNWALSDLAYGAGFGFRYATPIGPLGLDVGFPLTDQSRYADFMIHFNVGQTF
jgi:outer membrane protein assembly complex protein YaeT